MHPFAEPVQRYMSTDLATVPPGAQVSEAERRLRERGVSCLAVTTDDGKLVGVISRTDLLRVGRLRATMAGVPTLLSLPRLSVQECMVNRVVTVSPDASLAAAARRLGERHIHRLFVVEAGVLVGVLSTKDMMRAIVQASVATRIGDLMSSPVLTVETTMTIAQATDRLAAAHVRGLVVVEEEWPVGIFTQEEALAARTLDAENPVEEAMSCAMLCLPMRTPAHRAAAFALSTHARRILTVETRQLRGILTGVDLARVVAAGDAISGTEG